MTRPKTPPTTPHAAAVPPDPPRDALLFVDAIEDRSARLLLGQDAFDLPLELLPDGTREGMWLHLSLRRAAPPPDEGKDRRRELGRDDDGGDIIKL